MRFVVRFGIVEFGEIVGWVVHFVRGSNGQNHAQHLVAGQQKEIAKVRVVVDSAVRVQSLAAAHL